MIKTVIVVAASCMLAACLLAGCSTDTVPDKKYVDTYSDVIVVRERYRDSATVANKVDSILSERGYTEASFRQTLRDISENPDLFRGFNDSVSKELRRRRDTTHVKLFDS